MITTKLCLFLTVLSLHVVSAATADQWRSRSIYQLLTDRFAPPSETAPARTSPLPEDCDPGLQTWCGGTWLSIIDKLDYIQGMGFDAIWISPVSQNIDTATPYNYAYHGYWVNDPLSLNPRFGSSGDLMALSAALHNRGMFLMVDIVVNNIPSLHVEDSQNSAALSADGGRWTQPEYFHDHCWIDYSNATSVEYCWLGDDKLPLMDVNTEHVFVQSTLQTWIANFTAMYSVDGLRIDAAKHVPGPFWHDFCLASGVFCIGEVYGDDISFASSYQTQNYMDSVLGFPLYFGIVKGFGTPMGNMSAFVDVATQVLSAFPYPGLLGNFIENHDLPRWRNVTVDPQLAYNAMVTQFIFDGIPVVYFGQEQDTASGAADPYNRNALWPSGYTNTSTYQRLGRLNAARHAVIEKNTQWEGKNFLDSHAQIVKSTDNDVAIRRGPMLAALTNRGSPSQNATFGITWSGYPSQSEVIDLLSCRQYTVGSDQSISINYAPSGSGGMPYLFLSQADAADAGLCGAKGVATYTQQQTPRTTSASGRTSTSLLAVVGLFVAVGSAVAL